MSYDLVSAEALDADQRRVLRTIYEAGYPADRCAAWDIVSAAYSSQQYALALLRGDTPVGFAPVHAVRDSGRVYLRHLVIDGSRRGQGLGAMLWQCLTSFAAERGFTQLVWDVAHPDEPAVEPSTNLLHIGIFERVGGSLVPIGEYAAANGRGTDWVPMRLLATSLDGSVVVTDARALRQLALDVYAYRYETGSTSTAGAPDLAGYN